MWCIFRNLFAFFVIYLCKTQAQQSIWEEKPHVYEECPVNAQVYLGVSSGEIPDEHMTASSTLKKRQPSTARLYSAAGAWTPAIQDSNQYLQINLGKQFVITKIHTQGRRGSNEYVSEYFLQYSDDDETWRVYTNRFGIPHTFPGNTEDSNVQPRTLLYPIVAKYVRFSPQRWSQIISMRVELMGCEFSSNTSNFFGNGWLHFNMGLEPMRTTKDLLELRFKTNNPHGVLLYASGNQGDFISLQMIRGYLIFLIDLGSTQADPGLTELTVGSLLDDDQWHDVIVIRERKELKVVVDRLVKKVETKGLFSRLDLDKSISLGGVEHFVMEGIKVKYNFNGCIQNVKFNGRRLIRAAQALPRQPGVTVWGDVGSQCGIAMTKPVTFPSLESYLDIVATSGMTVHTQLDFRTHDDGLLLFHPMDAEGAGIVVSINDKGVIAYKITSTSGQVVEDVVRDSKSFVDSVNIEGVKPSSGFADGLWHTIKIEISATKVNCTVDTQVKVTHRELQISPGSHYYIGGHQLHTGFRGCMRDIQVAGRILELGEIETRGRNFGVQIGACALRDRCIPNPCSHGGVCDQSWNTFSCNCDRTGYKGEMCYISAHPLSCEMHKQYSNVKGLENAIIDPDGSGPLPPFPVQCNRDEDGRIVTNVGHDSEDLIAVNGYQDPGSYVRHVNYVTERIEALEDVIERAQMCRQYVTYRCNNSKLLYNEVRDPTKPNQPRTYGWWVGRTFQPMYYWGGAAPGSFKCSCGLEEGGCAGTSTTCNCDAGLGKVLSDQGYLVHKEYLPVLEMHFGDTGTLTDTKIGYHMLGKLECFGDSLFDNTVTFNMHDGVLLFPTFQANNAGDIWLQFKTTATDGVLVHCTGSVDFIELRLFQSTTMQFRYDIGNGVQVLAFKSGTPLNDDQWHTVHIEKSRMQAWLKVDDFPEEFNNEDADLIRLLDLNNELYIGALVDYSDGFVGCMRGLRVNGKLMDMAGKLREREVYGVIRGSVGKCASNPCFNGGVCRELYSRYVCDCAYTSHRGWNCGREVGINLKKNYLVRYAFGERQGLSATDFQYATIGFSTKVKQGILMQIISKKTREYISVEMNNNGGVKVVLDVGFQREEVNTPSIGIDFANTQVHVVTVRRSNKGRTILVQVDNYQPIIHTFPLSETSDTILDDPTYLYVGNNDTSNTETGFEGCIYRMQVDNVFPLKRAFQDPKPDFIMLVPQGAVMEDMCGFEEVTVAPEPIKTRPNRGFVLNITYPHRPPTPLSRQERSIIGVSVLLLFIVIVVILFVVFRSRFDAGNYATLEAFGAEFADDADTAVVYNQTGLTSMSGKFEYFM